MALYLTQRQFNISFLSLDLLLHLIYAFGHTKLHRRTYTWMIYVSLTPIEVNNFKDMSLERMRSILNNLNHLYVGAIVEFYATT